MRQAPSFTVVGEGALRAEAAGVVDEAEVRLPRQLDQFAAEERQTLAEILGGERVTLQHLPGLEIDLAQTSMRH